MKLPVAAYFAEVATSATKARSYGGGAKENQALQRRPISFSHPCNKWWNDGMMPPSCCLLLSRTRSLADYVWGERIDAETSDGVAAGED
jgi:hypothetical protein